MLGSVTGRAARPDQAPRPASLGSVYLKIFSYIYLQIWESLAAAADEAGQQIGRNGLYRADVILRSKVGCPQFLGGILYSKGFCGPSLRTRFLLPWAQPCAQGMKQLMPEFALKIYNL